MQSDLNYVVSAQTDGLWMRFFSRLIPLILFLALAFYVFFNLADPRNGQNIGILVFVVIIALVFFSEVFINNPLRWANTLVLDFEHQQIVLYKSRDIREGYDILDYPDEQLIIRSPEYIESQYYDNLLMEPYYLLWVFAENKRIPLVSLKNPAEYTKVVNLMQERMQLYLK